MISLVNSLLILIGGNNRREGPDGEWQHWHELYLIGFEFLDKGIYINKNVEIISISRNRHVLF
jgi:hypothetical protein